MREFFDAVRPLFKSYSQSQVDGINLILDATDRLQLEQRAYILATAFHETAGTMQPITEFGNRAYFEKYEPHTSIGKSLGNIYPGDGYKYRGRGFVQITGRYNYRKASTKLQRDFEGTPEDVKIPKYAVRILVDGMTEGWFTGKPLGQYVSHTKVDYASARRVVNGIDKASLIAGHAKRFEAALRKSAQDAPVGWAAWLLDLLRFWK